MEITPKPHAPLTLPLPLYTSVTIADAIGKDGEKFVIVAGLDQGMVAALKARSSDLSDTDLQKTSDYERFGKGSFEDWYASKERTLFGLIHPATGALAALAWFGPKPFGRKSMKHLSEEERKEDERAMDSGMWHTVVYRSYPPFRGTGLMKDFVRFAMETYQGFYPGSKLWEGIFSANAASIGLATALGFTIVGTEGEETLMVKE